MAGRLLFELFVFSIPFAVFGLYLLVTASAEQEGRRKWPIQSLFLTGIGLAVVAWFALIFLEPKDRGICHEPARFEDGVLIPARDYPCQHDVTQIGVPRERDGIREAQGAEGPEETRDPSEIRARAPVTRDSDSEEPE